MKICKRIGIGLLTLSLTLISPLSVLASNLGGNTQSGGGTGTASDAAYAHKFMMYPENMGYRISIVDKEGNRVTNSVDIVNYVPSDISSMQYNNSMAGGGLAEIQTGYKQYINWIGWKDYSANGWNKQNRFYYSNGIKTEEYTSKTWGTNGVPYGENKFGKVYTYMYPKKIFEGFLKIEYNNKVKAYKADEKIDATIKQQLTEASSISIPLPSVLNASKTHFSPGGVELEKIMKSYVGMIGKDASDTDKFSSINNVVTLMVSMKLPTYNFAGNKTGAVDYLFKYIDPKIQARVGKEEVNVETGEKKITTVADIVGENGYKVIFEPLYWYVPELLSIHPDMLNITQGKPNYGWMPGVCYGTVSYMAKYVYDTFNNLSDDHFKMSWTGSDWGGGQLGVTTLMIAFTDADLKINEPSSATVPPTEVPGTGQFSLYSLASGDLYKTSGYSLHIYDNILNKKQSGTPTWDKKTYPDGPTYKPGPSPENTTPDGAPKLPDYPSEGVPYVDPVPEKNKDHKFNIVKFYAEKQPDGSYKYKENHTRQNTVHTIDINDEPGYKVDNYYTSDKFEKPTNPTDDYDVWKTSKAPKKTKEGTKAEQIQILATDPDNTLYVRLVGTPMLTVVKYFPDGSTKIEEIPWQPSYDSTEPGYDYEQDKQNTNKPDNIPSTFGSTSGSPGSNPIISVDTSSKIVYINYKQPLADSKITLHQNELAHTFTLEDIQSLATLTHKFASKEGGGSDEHNCGGCISDSDGSWCPGHPCSWEHFIVDSNYSYSIQNKFDYASTTFVGSQGAFKSEETGVVDDSGSLGIGGGDTNGLTPNLKFSIYRDKAKDNVTLYPNKNNSVKGELAQIFITAEGYTPQTHRVQDQGQTEWYSNFKVDYQYTSVDNELSWDSSCSYNGDNHGDADSWSGTPHPGLETLNSPYSKPSNVLTKAYLGQPGTGDKVTTLTEVAFNILGMNFNNNLKFTPKSGDSGKFANDGKFFEFYPYTEMEYQTVTDLSNKLAYIVSTNLSKVRNNTSMEVGVYKSNSGYGINLSSEQWSTHARTIEGLNSRGVHQGLLNKSLIPGGAVVKLSTSNTNIGNGETTAETWVGFRSYEMCVPDDLKVSLSNTDGVKTTSEAKAAGTTFFNDMKNNLSNYHVEKWIKEGITNNEGDLDHSTKVSGINNIDGAPVSSFGGNQLSTDKKYYLKENSTDATLSKFDTIKDKFEQHVYRVSADVHGKVTVTKDGAEIVSSNIKSDRNLSALLANADVKRIDDRVKFVTNFAQSLDFEGGKDRELIPWYYEAHDGIEVVETMGAAQVGFGGSSPIRSETVDPKLTGKLENRDDTLNFNDATLNQKTRTVQYRMSASPKTKPGVAGYIGTFNGLDITVPSMNKVMRTRLHYMGNNTVMDLN